MAREAKGKATGAKAPASARGKGKPGRPAKFTEPEAMSAAIEAYFTGLEGDADHPDKPPTMAGLARSLGFADRQSLRDYAKRDGFSCVQKGIFRVEEWWETRLASNSPTGSIFWLKNHADYRDKSEVDNNVHTDEPLTLVLNGVRPEGAK